MSKMSEVINTIADVKDSEQERKKLRRRMEMIHKGIHNYSPAETYVKPTDPLVVEKLEWFQDQKLALMVHWGAYSQLGISPSWPLSDADAEWCRDRRLDWGVTGEEFKKQYFNLNQTFNPIRFEPETWADIASKAGIKYLIFTTKHHDGFCMWDSKYSEYKITAENCPFHTHKYADICAHLFEAFRKKGIGIAPYFSKADWHIDSYWSEGYDRGNYMYRGPSYEPDEHPEQWERFVTYTQNQIKELARNYGKLDIMWFDGGWVCEDEGQDIRLGEVMEEIRAFQPGMLCVDRTVQGPYENYITPELRIPEEPFLVPWESNLTLGTSFSYAYDDTYKSARQVIQLLVDIVAKGGNMAINVGAQPDGRLPGPAVETLLLMGGWLKVYGDAIYKTRVCAPYKKDGIAFTKKEHKVYAIQLFESEHSNVDSQVYIPYEGKVQRIWMTDTGESLPFETVKDGYMARVPEYTEREAPIGRVFCLE